MTKFIWVGAAVVAVALTGSPAMAAEPIPGVDIIVKKNPGGIAKVGGVSDAHGRFTLRIKAAGRYTLSSACPAGMRPCPAQLLSIYLPDRRPASGVRLIAAADGGYDVIVGRDETALSGVVCGTGAVTVVQKAAINTSRSNIKRPSVAMSGPEGEVELPGAPINTSRSNIKRPGVAAARAGGEARSPGPCDPKNELRRGGFVIPLIALSKMEKPPVAVGQVAPAAQTIPAAPLPRP